MSTGVGPRRWLALVIAVCALLASACSGGDESNDGGLLSIESTDEVETAAADEAVGGAAADETVAEPEQTDEEALLAFASCMRDEGVSEFPDPTVGADGAVQFDGIRDSGIDPRSEEFNAAREACQAELGDANFGGGRRAGVDRGAIEEVLLGFTECLRDNGLADVGDIEFGQPGQGAGAGQGQGRNNFDQNQTVAERIASRLDLDIGDPAVAEAIAACEPLLEELPTGGGRGGRGQGGGNAGGA